MTMFLLNLPDFLSPSNCRMSACADVENEEEFAVVDKKSLFVEQQFFGADDDMATLLADTSAFVQHLLADPSMSDALLFTSGGEDRFFKNIVETKACQPTMLDMTVPMNYVKGQAIQMTCDLGSFEMLPPDIAEPGDELQYYLGPLPEFNVEVPPNYGPGWALTVRREDGSDVRAVIPEGHGPGDTFNVEPPSLIVHVPDGVNSGDPVRFRGFCDAARTGNDNAYWYWALVPMTLRPGGYFVARLPPPK